MLIGEIDGRVRRGAVTKKSEEDVKRKKTNERKGREEKRNREEAVEVVVGEEDPELQLRVKQKKRVEVSMDWVGIGA